MGLDDLLHYGKPESRSFFFCGKKGRKDFLSSKTEGNLRENGHVELLIASKQVQASHALGQGCRISGKGELQTIGEFAEAAKERFPWARGALVIKVEEVKPL